MEQESAVILNNKMKKKTRTVGIGENWLYAFSGFGINIFFGMPMMFMLIYFTDVFGISASAVGTLFLISRIWDAVNDPMMGGFVDKTRTRWGKCRPYMIFGPIVLGVVFFFLFTGPKGLSGTGKLIYAYVTYILYGMAYTMVDIPGNALISRISDDGYEKTKVMTLRRVIANFGMLVGAAAVVPLVGTLGNGDQAKGYSLTAMIFAVIAALPIILSGLTAKERVEPVETAEKFQFRNLFSILKSNKPLLIVVLVFIVNQVAMSIKSASVAYYFTYNIGNVGLIALVSGISLIFTIIGTSFIPQISKKMGKKNGVIVAMALIGATSLGLFFTPYGNTTLIIVWFIINSLAAGVGLGLPFVIAIDSVEYGEWKTGKRTEGLVFSMLTFGSKLASALGGAVLGYILDFTGYVANAEQTPLALQGILFSMAIIPIIVSIVGIFLMKFYNLTDGKLAEIMNELKKRKEE